jgi:UDP-2-acetamido-3-amino-2,3-dideoxy-glucuronate N-acetyltransferase
MTGNNSFIHPTAVIDQGATIGSGTRVWHFSHLMAASRIGDNCIIGQNVYIDNNVVIGNGVKIQNNVSVYNGVVIEDDVFLGPSMVFTNVMNPRSFIERKNEFKKTIVKKGSSIGANATILCGIEIGRYAMIGAGSVVLENAPDYSLIAGNPAKQIGWVSKSGNKLKFDKNGAAKCSHSGQIYKLINDLIVEQD